MNGAPHSARLASRIQDLATGAWDTKLPIHRSSCPCECSEMSSPAQMNRRALNRAWITIWNIAIFGRPRPIAVIIMPS